MQCVCYTHLYVDVLDEGSNESNDDFTLCDISQRVSSKQKNILVKKIDMASADLQTPSRAKGVRPARKGPRNEYLQNKKISWSKRLTWHPRISKTPSRAKRVPRKRALRARAHRSRTPRRSDQSRPPRDSDRKAPMLYAARHHAGLPADSPQTLLATASKASTSAAARPAGFGGRPTTAAGRLKIVVSPDSRIRRAISPVDRCMWSPSIPSRACARRVLGEPGGHPGPPSRPSAGSRRSPRLPRATACPQARILRAVTSRNMEQL